MLSSRCSEEKSTMTEKNPNDQWLDCPDGVLASMVAERQRTAQRRSTRRILASTAIVAVGIAVVGISVSRGPFRRDYRFGGITCTQVRRLMPAYEEGQLDPDVRQQIATHLTECPECGPESFVQLRTTTPQLQAPTHRTRYAAVVREGDVSNPARPSF